LNGVRQKGELIGSRYFGSSSLHDAFPNQLRAGVIYARASSLSVFMLPTPDRAGLQLRYLFTARQATALGMTMGHTGAVTCW